MSEAKEQELAQLTAQIKEKHSLIGEHYQEIARLERELRALEDERLARAPRSIYRHRREDGSTLEVEAAIVETDGAARCIWYQIPRKQARRGEEDAYIRWLRTEDQLSQLREY
jgi:septal ring factor EnvC (AmiA/AmiB activator)